MCLLRAHLFQNFLVCFGVVCFTVVFGDFLVCVSPGKSKFRSLLLKLLGTSLVLSAIWLNCEGRSGLKCR